MCAPTLASLTGEFGAQQLIGKSCAIVGDARISGDVQVLVERLLTLSGEDPMSVARKHKAAWYGRLGVRFMLVSNELPRLADASNAVMSRFVVPAPLTESFLGREDLKLGADLTAELPAILNWALAGLDRLTKNGRFTEPGESQEVVAELEALASPVLEFVADECQTGNDELTVPVDGIYDRYRDWCFHGGRPVSTKTNLWDAPTGGVSEGPEGAAAGRGEPPAGVRRDRAAPPRAAIPGTTRGGHTAMTGHSEGDVNAQVRGGGHTGHTSCGFVFYSRRACVCAYPYFFVFPMTAMTTMTSAGQRVVNDHQPMTSGVTNAVTNQQSCLSEPAQVGHTRTHRRPPQHCRSARGATALPAAACRGWVASLLSTPLPPPTRAAEMILCSAKHHRRHSLVRGASRRVLATDCRQAQGLPPSQTRCHHARKELS